MIIPKFWHIGFVLRVLVLAAEFQVAVAGFKSSFKCILVHGATGQSFAILALVQNPDQNWQALLLAGANAAGTQVAGNFAADLPGFW